MNYNYRLTATYTDCEREYATNSLDSVLAEWYSIQQDCPPLRCHIMDGYTGEVLASYGQGEETYMTREWYYILTAFFLLNF
jgi:hypothetical protein